MQPQRGMTVLVLGATGFVGRALVPALLPRDRRYWELSGHAPGWTFRAAADHALQTEVQQPGVPGWLSRRGGGVMRRLGRRSAQTGFLRDEGASRR
jgi:uncharacterized protein YbjT (DUF2867 family)